MDPDRRESVTTPDKKENRSPASKSQQPKASATATQKDRSLIDNGKAKAVLGINVSVSKNWLASPVSQTKGMLPSQEYSSQSGMKAAVGG